MLRNFKDADRLTGIILMAIAAALWSTSGIGIKYVDWHPLAIAGIRSGIAAIVIRAFFRNTPFHIDKPTLIGGAAYALMLLTFVASNKLTTAANAILLQYTNPLYVAILSAILLKEKCSRLDWASLVVVGGGILLFFQDQMSAGSLTGNLLALASGFAMAVMIITMRMQKDGSPFGVALIGNIMTFICGIPFAFDGSPGATGWGVLIALGVFQTGLAYALYSVAIKHVTALEASIIAFIEPLLNPVWVFLMTGETPGTWSLIGGMVILTALIVRSILPSLRTIHSQLSVPRSGV